MGSGLWEWLCSVQIFNAIPSPSFSAPAELRTFALDPLEGCPLFKPDPPLLSKGVLNTSSPPDFVRFLRRTARQG